MGAQTLHVLVLGLIRRLYSLEATTEPAVGGHAGPTSARPRTYVLEGLPV
jgi:hypothetical protein